MSETKSLIIDIMYAMSDEDRQELYFDALSNRQKKELSELYIKESCLECDLSDFSGTSVVDDIDQMMREVANAYERGEYNG